jgi:hypothetical protein
MLTPRNLVIVAAAAGALTGLPWSNAQACDNDRFPCPIVQEAPTQDSADAPARASAQKKKSTQAAQQGEKPSAKAERDPSQAPARPKASKPPAQEQADSRAKAGKPAGQQAETSGAPPVAEAAPAVVPPPEPSRSADAARIESAPAAPAAVVPPASAGAASIAPSAPVANATQTAAAGNVKVVDPNEVNELDLAAAAPAPAPAESSWLSYLLVTLGGALAAASTVRLFLF